MLTKELTGAAGRVTQVHGCQVEWSRGPKGWQMKELSGTEFTIAADLVLLAMGFLHVAHEGLIHELGLKLDAHGNVAVDNWMTSDPAVFAAGDTVKGASLVVHAIHHGRQAAKAIDAWLTGG